MACVICTLPQSALALPPDVNTIEKTAKQGDAKAQAALGFMYYLGRGVAQNDVEAAYWISLAAEQDEALAQVTLGFMYATGRGVQADMVLAYKWTLLAAKHDAKFTESATMIEAQLTPEQKAKGQALAAEFVPKVTPKPEQ